MKKSRARAAAFAGVFAVAGSTGAAAASAAPNPPVVVFDDTIEHSGPDEVCGVEATTDVSVRVRVTEWYDEDGEFVRGQAKLNGTTTIASEPRCEAGPAPTNPAIDIGTPPLWSGTS